MGKTRIFIDQALSEGDAVVLPPDAAHHVSGVLRMRAGEALILFNGRGGEYAGEIVGVDKKSVRVAVGAKHQVDRESPLAITLVQAISRGERMDYTVQKAVELGVMRIVPLLSARVTVRLDAERERKRLDHWRQIIIGACAQSGRTRVPELMPVMPFSAWLHQQNDDLRLLLTPAAGSMFDPAGRSLQRIQLCVGPEGGFSEDEIRLAQTAGCLSMRLGPRILRTETAPVAALSILQHRFGDL